MNRLLQNILPVTFLLLSLIGCSTLEILSLNTEEERDATASIVTQYGARYNVTGENLDAILEMLDSEKPQQRQAALRLLEKTESEDLFPVILKRIDDSDPTVSNEAFRILKKKETLAKRIILNSFQGNDILLQHSGLSYIRRAKDKSYAPHLIPLLSAKEINIRRNAAKAAALFDIREDTLLKSPDPYARSGAYLLLGFQKDKKNIPLLINGLYDPSPLVRESVEEALSHYQKETLPDLFNVLNSAGEIRYATVSALRIIGKLESQKVLNRVIPLLNSPFPEVREEARRIILSYKEGAISPLLTFLSPNSPEMSREIIEILGQTTGRDDDVIPQIFIFCSDDNIKLRRAAKKALLDRGDTAFSYLHFGLYNSNPLIAQISLDVLRENGDPQLIMDELTKKINSEKLKRLVFGSTKTELISYMQKIDLDTTMQNEILHIENISTLSRQYTMTKKTGNDYFTNFLKWEELMIKSDKERKLSSQYNHEYLKTNNAVYLRQAKRSEQTAHGYYLTAKEYHKKGVLLAPSIKQEGALFIRNYLAARKNLTTELLHLSPGLHPLMESILKDNNLTKKNLENLSRIIPEYIVTRDWLSYR